MTTPPKMYNNIRSSIIARLERFRTTADSLPGPLAQTFTFRALALKTNLNLSHFVLFVIFGPTQKLHD